jgi:hypothetical protein
MNIPPQNNAYFQSYLNKSRSDKFILVFSLPEALKVIKTSVNRKNNAVIPDTIQFSVYGNVIPTISVPEKEVPYGGQVMKVTSYARPTYEKNTIDFTVDNMFNNYWVIYKWLQLFNDERIGNYSSQLPRDTGSLKNYETNMSVFGLDEYNNRVIEFKYYHAFPVSLGGIKYSDRDPNEIKSSFEYVYHQFEANLL